MASRGSAVSRMRSGQAVTTTLHTLHVNDRSNRDAQGRINNGERINTRHHQKRHRGVM